MKKITRTVAGLASASLLGLTPLALGAPANAQEPTTVDNLYVSEGAIVHGEKITIRANVVSATSGSVQGGVATLFELPAGAGEWAPIATDDTPGYTDFADVKPKSNSQFKIVYSGGTSAYGAAYAPVESAPFEVKVGRKITAPKKGLVLKGKVSPSYKKKKIVIKVSKKSDKGFKKFRTIKTNKKGKYRIALPKRKGTWYYQVRTKGDKKFIANGYTWRVWVF